MNLDESQEKWFDAQGGGYFISILEGSFWLKASNISGESITNMTKRIEAAKKWKSPKGADMIYLPDFHMLFHAIRFPSVDGEPGRQWDAVNGFRDKVEPKSMQDLMNG